MISTAIQFKGYDELETFLRKWESFGGKCGHDLSGIIGLLEACLDNIRENSFKQEFEWLDFSKENIELMKKMIAGAERYHREEGEGM